MALSAGGKIIRHIKTQFGLKYNDLAFIFGFGENTIKNWCNGHSRPAFDDVLIIADYYNLNVNELLSEINKVRANDNIRKCTSSIS
jgi:transcriptional regulator with XRE-family HTH domain